MAANAAVVPRDEQMISNDSMDEIWSWNEMLLGETDWELDIIRPSLEIVDDNVKSKDGLKDDEEINDWCENFMSTSGIV